MSGGLGVSTVEAGGASALRRWRRERLFFSGMAVAITAIVFIGFAPTYFLKGVYGTPPLSTLLQVHGALFTAWIALLLLQTALVAGRQTPVHRRIGVIGGVLGAAMMVAGYLASIDAVRRGSTMPPMSAEAFLAIPLATMIVFPALIASALALRRRPDFHKRLMLVGTAELASAALARVPVLGMNGPVAFFAATDMLLVAIALYDIATLGRIHRATLWGGLFLIASQWARVAVANTEWWVAVATWLTN